MKRSLLNTILLLKRILLPKREPLPRWKSASCSKDEMSPSSLGESYSNIPSSSSSCFRCFLATPRSQSVRDWPVRRVEFLSDWGSTGMFQLLPSLFPVRKKADALRQQTLTPSPSSSVCSVVPLAQVVTVEILVRPTGSWHVLRIWIYKTVRRPMGCPLQAFFGCFPKFLG